LTARVRIFVEGQKVERPTAKTILEYLALMSVLLIAGQPVLSDNIPISKETIDPRNNKRVQGAG
jgi:hypothetical protein